MSFAEVVCCKKLPNITDELSIEAISVDPEQTAPIHTVCHRGFFNISADVKSRRLLLRLALYGLKSSFMQGKNTDAIIVISVYAK